MVKPPKTMQPEAVNLKKAGRDANKAFGDDSFRNYMARKIAMQRQQFGVVLPPVPPLDAQDARNQGKMIDAGPGDNHEQRFTPLGRSPPTNNGGAHDNDDNDRPFAAKRKRFGKSGMAKRSKTTHGEEIMIKPLLLKSPSDKSRPDDDLTPRKRSPSKSSPSARETEAAAAQLLTSSALTGRQQESPSHGASQSTARIPDCQLVTSPYATKLRSDLFFLGTVVLINGYTNPDAETLQRILHKHGGDVEKYETSRVTHIIAEQLSTAKAKMYQKQRNPRPVCVPGWIIDSVQQGKKLPCAAYLLDEVRKESLSATKSVASFYEKKQRAAHPSPAKTSILPPLPSPGGDTEDPKQLESPEKNRFINGRIRTVGTDPNFLESFFAASRLSFIGSYRQRTSASPSKTPTAHENTTRYVFHVDMDCFFASVVLRNFPEYRDKPVAISHNGIRKNDMTTGRNVPANSSSECATCNYVAREFGIKKGMYLGRAKELCPELIVLQYDFDGYEEVSEAVHEILLRHSAQHDGFIEQVSCDESYIEMFLPNATASCSKQAAISLAETIRNEIFEATQCTATVGVASNKLLAKLATDFAKPNKSYLVENPRSLLSGLDLHQLPGVGYHFRRKLQEHLLVSVADVWKRGPAAEDDLCDIVGNLNGKKLYAYCHGIDNRELQPSVRKTIGAECSYGVRFDGPHGPDHMIRGLCEEVEKKMTNVGVRCKKITVKIKQRKPNAPPPPKFLGHGSCYNHSKSDSLPGQATRSAKDMVVTAMNLFNTLKIPADDIRGMGIVASNLVHDHSSTVEPVGNNAKIAILFDAHHKRVALDESSRPTKANHEKPCDRISESDCQASDVPNGKPLRAQARINNEGFIIPSLSQIHMSQVDELPSPMRREIISQMGCARKAATRLAGPPCYKQMHVERLFRLAEVKSRPGDISLTQLDCLPLELQLEIANEDGVFAPHEVSKAKQYDIVSTELQEVSVLHIDARQEDRFDREMSKPFSEFMDEHSVTDDENVWRVQDFLCLCVAEGRAVDVVVLLRQLRNRADAWKRVYNRVYKVVDDKVEQCAGNRLDRSWVDQ